MQWIQHSRIFVWLDTIVIYSERIHACPLIIQASAAKKHLIFPHKCVRSMLQSSKVSASVFLAWICQVFTEGRLHHILDGLNEQRSNWMRYVNPARTVEEQNLVACQNGLEIYFYTIKPLQPGQELLVWYCQELAQRCNYPPLGQLSMDSSGKFRCSFASIKSKLQMVFLDNWG